MKICDNCNTFNSDDAKFCKHCGASLPENLIESHTQSETTEQTNGYVPQSNFLNLFNIAIAVVVLAVGVAVWTVGAPLVSLAGSAISGINGIVTFVGDKTAYKTVDLTNVIINKKEGIQELATASNMITIKRNILEKQGLLVCDYTTKKFICDFDYTVKYGYDLASLTAADITQDNNAKTVTIRLPQGKITSNELIKTSVRHNEGIIGSYNTVKAEDMDLYQSEAKSEAADKALKDKEFLDVARKHAQYSFERIVHAVAPEYKVILL